MIRETIVTTQDLAGRVHIAPLGLIVEGEHLIIAPFRPSRPWRTFAPIPTPSRTIPTTCRSSPAA
jgi:hypothetical protein